MVRRKLIRTLVERLLAEYHVRSAPVPVMQIAKGFGLNVHLMPAEADLSGFLYRDRTQKTAIIGVNADHHPNRQQFTTAHEFGHYLLHDFDEIHVDRRFKVWLRSPASGEGTDLEEREANLFAAELLMPAQFLAKDVERIGAVDLLEEDVLRDLAEQYGVSTQAMTFRLAYLGYVKL